MKEEKQLQIQTEFRIENNSQFLFFDNYIISIFCSYDDSQLQFYNSKIFKKEFNLKPDEDKDFFFFRKL